MQRDCLHLCPQNICQGRLEGSAGCTLLERGAPARHKRVGCICLPIPGRRLAQTHEHATATLVAFCITAIPALFKYIENIRSCEHTLT